MLIVKNVPKFRVMFNYCLDGNYPPNHPTLADKDETYPPKSLNLGFRQIFFHVNFRVGCKAEFCPPKQTYAALRSMSFHFYSSASALGGY
jgi:hypothetical protein